MVKIADCLSLSQVWQPTAVSFTYTHQTDNGFNNLREHNAAVPTLAR